MTLPVLAAAEWMLGTVNEEGVLYQDQAAAELAARFGDELITINDAGNVAIQRSVLTAFRKISGDTVVWDRGERCWRIRDGGDLPGRQQI